ncbi:MAG: quinoprotein relay system zinc metallohydrolase 1 [Desulfuromonas sp.]|nr:quinoprotein relay system zinc metallohydrolase 1 [Desulfuromonas sp.]
MRCLLILLCSCFFSVATYANYQLTPKKIAENTWLVEGSTDNFSLSNGGNIVNAAFIVTDKGVVVIDSGPSFAYGKSFRLAIASVTEQPVIQMLLTHHHPDHVLGNQAFADVPIAALAGTKKLLQEQGDHMAENMYRVVGDWMRGTEVLLPSQIVEEGVLDIGGHPLRLLSLTGHTGADLAILDERTGVLFAGDLVFYQRALATPNTPNLSAWLADIDTLQKLPWKLIVPGHGPLAADQQPFAQMRDYLTWLDTTLREAAQTGQDMNQVLRMPIPERFSQVSLTRYELIRTVSHLYPQYEQQAWQRLDQE